jgi:PAS domain S-box-containing protein
MSEGKRTGCDSRVLIIDDEPASLRATSRLLDEAGYQVSEAATTGEALRQASGPKPDLILLAATLAQGEKRAASQIKTDVRLSDVPVLLLAGPNVDAEVLVEDWLLDPNALVIQPAATSELLIWVEAMLRIGGLEPHRRAHVHALQERVEELNCLYAILRLVEQAGGSLPKILQAAVELIPPSWQYPQDTCARIISEGQEFRTEDFRETAFMQSSDLRIHGEITGRIEVAYLGDVPEGVDTPFLKEEQQLLGAIAEQLGRSLERVQAEKALRRYEAVVASLSDPISIVDREYRYRLVNDAYTRYAKMSREEILGLSIDELLGSEAFEGAVKPHFDRCLAGEEVEYQAWFEVPGDGPKFMHVNYCPMFDEHRAVVGVVVASRDLTDRRLAEEALERERGFVARMMETSPVGILVFNREGRITFANSRVQQMAELHGTPAIMGRAYNDPIWQLLSEDGDPLPDESLPYARVVRSGEPVSDIIYAIESPGGQRAYLSSSAAPFLDGSGEIDGVIVTTEDVTARVQAEVRLRDSEKRYRELLEALQEGIWVIDQDAHTAFVNPRMAEMLGYTVEEMVGRHLFAFMDEGGVEISKRKLARRHDGIREQHDFEFVRKDGSRLYASMETSTIYDEEGNYAGAIAGVQDVTARVKAMARLRESEERYRELVEQVSDVIYALDTEGTLAYVNPAIEGLLGYEPEQVIGQPFSKFILPADLRRITENFQQLASGRLLGPNEYRVVAASGEIRWIRISSQPIVDGDQVTGIRGVLTDISERVLEDEQREEAVAAAERERLARDLHDAVTQSLFSVSAIAEALPVVWERDQDAARRGLEELRQLTQGALAEMRTLLLELRPSALMEQGLDVLLHQLTEAMAGRTRVPVKIQVTGDCALPPEVRIAFYRIAQEALNNTTKHARATAVRVELDCRPEYARLHISDDGRGFDPEHVRPGRLGMDIMCERAQAIGAAFWVESQPDQGTHVQVEWQGVREGEDDG